MTTPAAGPPKQQRRGRRIAMSPEELDAFLAEERTCRVATVNAEGRPHNTPLWFVWDGTALWLNSIVKSQRWTDIARNANVSVMVDAGHDFGELRGAELVGRLVAVGEIPRTTDPDAELAEPERLFAVKYSGSSTFQADGRHAWLRLVPEKVVSWDFRKMGR
jgi:Pyridoxamine 5'-phosphate oxidase